MLQSVHNPRGAVMSATVSELVSPSHQSHVSVRDMKQKKKNSPGLYTACASSRDLRFSSLHDGDHTSLPPSVPAASLRNPRIALVPYAFSPEGAKCAFIVPLPISSASRDELIVSKVPRPAQLAVRSTVFVHTGAKYCTRATFSVQCLFQALIGLLY
jgi:hypothetical protein